MAQYRTCPRTGLQFDLAADKLMRWNAVAVASRAVPEMIAVQTPAEVPMF